MRPASAIGRIGRSVSSLRISVPNYLQNRGKTKTPRMIPNHPAGTVPLEATAMCWQSSSPVCTLFRVASRSSAFRRGDGFHFRLDERLFGFGHGGIGCRWRRKRVPKWREVVPWTTLLEEGKAYCKRLARQVSGSNSRPAMSKAISNYSGPNIQKG
jgi:hypothetical protein